MSKRSPPGNNVVSRLSRRSQGGLYRRQVAGGGEVYTGPTATAALRTLGARAFTMDNSIFVAEDFDTSDPGDQALYAHERHHQLNSGGDGAAASFHDAEELAARAIERMVLHRAEQGEDFGEILRSVESQRMRTEGDVMRSAHEVGGRGGPASARQDTRHIDSSGQTRDPAQDAYVALRQRGRTHDSIIEELAFECVMVLGRQQDDAADQQGDSGFL